MILVGTTSKLIHCCYFLSKSAQFEHLGPATALKLQACYDAVEAVAPKSRAAAAPFDAGLADRRAIEEWFASLKGDFKKGASYWAGQRSLPKPGSCYA